MSGDRPCGARSLLASCRFGFGGAWRAFPALALLALVVPAAAAAQPAALTERRAIELALSRPAYRDLEQGRMGVAESATAEAGLWPNPTLAWDRDRVGGSGGDTTETTILLSQTLDLSGRRALRRDAAADRLKAARFDRNDRRAAVVADVRRQFGEALHRERMYAALEAWRQRIESAAAIVARLAKSGEVSGYDQRRMSREAQTARARAAGTAADSARLRELLAGLTGEPSAQLDGALLPDAVPSIETLQSGLRERPDLASLDAQATAQDRERSAAGRGWIPDVTVGIGQKRVEEPGRSDQGPKLAISIPIPLFDRSQAGRQRSEAQASMLRAEHALAYLKSQAELRGIWQQAVGLREAAETYHRESLNGSRELSRIAEAAYRAGEGSVLELLDAYRSELDTELTVLELELRARMTRIELDLLSGAIVHEQP